MKIKLFAVFSIALFFASCNTQKSNPEHPMFQLSDSSYIAKTDSSVLLPTHYFLADSISVFPDNVIAESDCILPENSFREKPDTLHLKGDTLYHKGEEVPKDLKVIKYDTELVLKTEGVYIYSKRMLERCQINIEYTEPAIFNKVFGRFSSRSNRTLDFLNIQSNRYVYYAPYTNWEIGGYSKFDNMKIMYDPERRDGFTFYMFDNSTTFQKIDLETHLPHFKAYLIQQ